MQSCKYMNKISEEVNKNKVGRWQPNKDIKCNDCKHCQKIKSIITLDIKLEEQNKIDLQLIKAYKDNTCIQECLQEFEYLENELTKPHEKHIVEELDYLKAEVTEFMIMYCRTSYANYLLENGVEEAKDEKFIYTNKFMLLAKDVV